MRLVAPRWPTASSRAADFCLRSLPHRQAEPRPGDESHHQELDPLVPRRRVEMAFCVVRDETPLMKGLSTRTGSTPILDDREGTPGSRRCHASAPSCSRQMGDQYHWHQPRNKAAQHRKHDEHHVGDQCRPSGDAMHVPILLGTRSSPVSRQINQPSGRRFGLCPTRARRQRAGRLLRHRPLSVAALKRTIRGGHILRRPVVSLE